MTGFVEAPPAPAAIVITDDGGGLVDKYALAAVQYRKEHRRVIIDGSCRSACTLALSVQNVCVTPRAVVKFHLARNIEDYEPRYDVTEKMLAVIPTAVSIAVNGHLKLDYTPTATLNYSELRMLGIADCGSGLESSSRAPANTDAALAVLSDPKLLQKQLSGSSTPVEKPAQPLRRIDSPHGAATQTSDELHRKQRRVDYSLMRFVQSLWR